MSVRGWIGAGVAVVVVGAVLGEKLGSRPEVTAGSPLRPCPDTPNCAQTAVGLEASPATALEAARAALDAIGADVSEEADGALTATARVGPFTDLVEIAAEPREGGTTLWVKSRATQGRSDLGVNARRVGRIVRVIERSLGRDE